MAVETHPVIALGVSGLNTTFFSTARNVLLQISSAATALLDRLEGKDANNILQSYTDILPGRPTIEHHRAPQDDLRNP